MKTRWTDLKKRDVILAVAGVVLLAVVLYFSLDREPDGLHVPLGVEQAAIITYGGPLVAVAPYKWGVAVNVRIAGVEELPGRRVYDVRYIVNRGGTFDLRDYLVATDGSGLADLPTFRFTGDAKLAKDLDTRITETEDLQIEVGGRYFETLALLGVLWIGWLLLLIFYKRPRPENEAEAPPAGPTAAEMMRRFLAKLESNTLDAADKARMEMLLLRCWREELGLGPVPMRTALQELGRDKRTAEPLRKIQHWLHHPASPVPGEEIAAVLAPYAVGPTPLEDAAP